MLSIAYHKSLSASSASGNHFLTFGLQGGIDQTNLNFGNLSTQAQWADDSGRDQSLENGESLLGDNAVLLDFQAGLIRRYVVHGGAKFGMGARVYMVPNLVFMQQNNSNVINNGLLLAYNLASNTQNQIVTAGAWLGNTDAVIANIGFEFKNFQLGVNYDLIISDLRSVTNRGGFEISLNYNFRKSIATTTKSISNPHPRL